MTDLIQANSVRIKSMADGSLDLTVRIEPKDMIAAVSLFGQPGIALVLGRLLADHEKATQAKEEVTEKPKGGPLSQLAGQWCNDETFQRFLNQRYGEKCTTKEETAQLLRHLCGVESRADLDHDPDAKAEFHKIRLAFINWSTYGRTSADWANQK